METEYNEFVQSLARGLSVLQAFDNEHSSMTLSDVAKRTGLSRGTSRRLLFTLAQLGFVGSDGKHFWLKPSVMDLGYRYLSSQPWWRVAQPIIEEAAAEANESCNAAILEGTDIIYMTGVAVNRIVSTTLSIGSHLPAFATASGRVLLAHASAQQLDDFFAQAKLQAFTPHTITDPARLREIIAKAGANGHCLVERELEMELRSIAVPIFDRSGRAVAALAISSHAYRMPARQALKAQVPILKATAARITGALPR